MADFTYFDQIEAFVNQTMPEEERQKFEAELPKNEVLQKELKAYRATLIAAEMLGFDQLKERVEEPKKGRIIAFPRWASIAAAIVLLAIISGLIYAQVNFTSTQLYSQALANSSIDYSNPQDVILREAWTAFQAEDYNTTLQILSPDRSTNEQRSEDAQLLYIYTLIRQGSAELALPLLNGIPLRNEDAQWYRVLALLQTKQKWEAKALLNVIVQNPVHPYFEQAQDSLDQLNSFWSSFAR
ncbi:MAG: hypothetical protein AAF242_01095 [Bacteroidota bacterium]